MKLDIILAKDMNVPMVIASEADPKHLLDLIDKYHAVIIEQLNQYGAILFRGFACQDMDYFSKAIEICGLGNRCTTKDYAIPRTLLPNDIYTSSDLPGHILLPLHHEKPRSKNPPNHLYFCCVTPAIKGGGTILANAEAIWLDIPKKIQDKIIEHGVLYKQFFHSKSLKYYLLKKVLGTNSARNWSEHFNTETKTEIEKKLTNENVNWAWVNNDNDLIVLNNLPGAVKHHLSNQMCWFNSSNYLNYYSNLLYGELKTLRSYKYLASQYLILNDILPMVCHYGDGQAFSSEDILAINCVLQDHSFVINWQKGDFMIIDNFTYMHGKQKHQGDRLLYSCMTQLINLL